MSPSGLFWIKVIFAAALAAVGMTGALLPRVLGGLGGSTRMLALGDTFAGGVLGGAGLIHLLSGGIDAFGDARLGLTYPFALLLAGVGFLLMLLIEGVIVASNGCAHRGPGAPRTIAAQHETGWRRGSLQITAYPVILLTVLSVHSLILGLALGAQSARSAAVVIFLAIAAHKGAAGFALGIGYQRARFSRRHALLQFTFFAAMTPLGTLVGAGTSVVLAGPADRLFEAIFDSLGAGTLIYIAALDIIKAEFASPEHRVQKWFAAALGFGLTALLAIWV